MSVEHRTVGRAIVSRAVSAQNWTIRPSELGFHFLELTGIEEVVISVWEERGNRGLHFLNAFFGRWITCQCASNLVT